MNYYGTYYTRGNQELYHFGVAGMKWGVHKKYENFSGSYTKAGVKRFNDSVSKYDKAKSNYDKLKESGASRYDVKLAKGKVKVAKAQVKKDYKHLSYDMKGDKGKVRYMQGERITGNSNVSALLRKGAAMASTGASYLYKSGSLQSNTYKQILAGSAVAVGASYVYDFAKSRPNNELRAYYGHTSNY